MAVEFLCKIMSDSTYTVSQAQAKLPRLIKQDSFAISVHGKVKGFYLSKERLEAMIETMELLGNPEFLKALKEHKSGKMKFHTVEELDKEFSA
jgi:PHD/YefM family antitoxin component YafN of YafNO toxin-antitoxin module